MGESAGAGSREKPPSALQPAVQSKAAREKARAPTRPPSDHAVDLSRTSQCGACRAPCAPRASVGYLIVTIWPRRFSICASFSKVDETPRKRCVRCLVAALPAPLPWLFRVTDQALYSRKSLQLRTLNSYISSVLRPDVILARHNLRSRGSSAVVAHYFLGSSQ